jgi:PleD family two-component response regulator
MNAPGFESLPVVLVADDDPMVRVLVGETLRGAGFTVVEAVDGQQALDLFARHQPQLVVLDVMMPVLDGYAACAALRRLPGGRSVPILMLTGLEDVDSVAHAYEAGATDFASKPINWLILRQRVRYLLRASRALEDLHRSEARLRAAQATARLGNFEWDLQTGRAY